MTTREDYRETAQDTEEDNQRASQDLITSQPLDTKEPPKT